MKITIVTSSQKELSEGKIVGGAPVVARRQAKALKDLGVDVVLLDLNKSNGNDRIEWYLPDISIKVISHYSQFGLSDDLPEFVIPLCKQVLSEVSEDWLFVQETWGGAVLFAAKTLGKKVIFQPNDYSFLCARSWFLKGDGTRCDMLPEPTKCGMCQVKGRTFKETFGLKLFKILEQKNIGNFPKIFTLQKKASVKAKNINNVLEIPDFFIAQSVSMLKVLLKQRISEERIFHVNYGIEPFSSTYRQKEVSDIVTFSFIARPSYEKGLHVLLKAWSKLDSNILSRAKLLVFSPIDTASPNQRDRLLNLLKICKNVEVFNISVSQRLDEIYGNIDVAIQPSLWIDHNTQTILEALCRSVPVVVPSHTSFAHDIVKNEVNGLLVDLNKSESLTESISKLVQNRDLLIKLKSADSYRFYDSEWAKAILQKLNQLN